MMQGIRKAGQNWLGKIVVAILFSFLILSFAVWGIGDMVRGTNRQTVASVGSTDITAVAFRDAYQQELQQLSRRARRAVTNEEARSFGLERQVLSKMMTEAALDNRARSYGLAISDDTIIKAILTDPTFRGANGQFDRARFNELIRSNGFTEQAFMKAQRAVYLRQQLADTLAGQPGVPAALREAIHRYQSETRSITYLTLGPDRIGAVPPPDATQLQAFFDQRKASFRAPDYRRFTYVALGAADVAQPDTVNEAEARAFYKANPERFGQPERRSVQQIVFPSADEANAASERLKGGLAFDALVAERNLGASDIDLGLVSREAIIDPAVADAAFALPAGSVSAPVQGRFGTVLVRVASIQAEAMKPFEEAFAEIRTEIARGRARELVQAVHDKIEDQRASARPLSEIAKDLKLTVNTVNGIDRLGRDKAGQPLALPDREALLKAVFASDIGVDNEAVASREGGWVWFEIAGIEPARDRTLAEVKAQVEAAWMADETATRVADKAAEVLKAVRAGQSMEDAAAALGTEVKTAVDIRRQGGAGLPTAAVSQVFATPVGELASAVGATPQERLVLRVTGAEVPPLLSTTQAATQLDEQLRMAIGDDILSAYVQKTQAELGTSTNDALMRQTIGGGL